jgi:hypothetical protein
MARRRVDSSLNQGVPRGSSPEVVDSGDDVVSATGTDVSGEVGVGEIGLPDVAAKDGDLAADLIARYAREVVDQAPPLTEEQRVVLRELLRPRRNTDAV